jgi:F0F1-type ATP synthase gamma subunit
MVNLKEIVKEIESLFDMKTLVTAYEEIASMKMRRLRGNVLTSRSFINELAEIYQEITTSYKNQILALMKKKKVQGKNLSLHSGNGKNACVFLSANSGLFSEILRKTYREFINYTDMHDAEPVIIGEFGKKLFEQEYPERKYVYFPMGESGIKEAGFKTILEGLLEYENIVIFYARFESMSVQDVAMFDFSGIEKDVSNKKIAAVTYLFEPSLEVILNFFEKQIFSSILDQTFTESDLARYAARMIILDQAIENIGNRMKEIDLQKKIATHRMINKKQLETISSISLW